MVTAAISLVIAIEALLLAFLVAYGIDSLPGWQRWSVIVGVGVVFLAFFAALPLPGLVANSAVVIASASMGAALSRALRGRSAVISFVIAAAVVDLWSFSGGVTRALLDRFEGGAEDIVRLLAVVVTAEGRTLAIVGIGDLGIASALLLGLARTGYPLREVAPLLVGAVVAAIAVGLSMGGAAALPFLAVATVAYLGLRTRPVAVVDSEADGPPEG